jgi:hypothetical protein
LIPDQFEQVFRFISVSLDMASQITDGLDNRTINLLNQISIAKTQLI